jgi:DeoR/GlpR family transcriptional regulator of sugar metabolism
LVGGALAFAAGAAIAAALPHTTSEDEVLGEAADTVKADIASRASDLIDQGQDIAADASDMVASVASDIHDAAKNRIVEEAERVKGTDPTTAGVVPRR